MNYRQRMQNQLGSKINMSLTELTPFLSTVHQASELFHLKDAFETAIVDTVVAVVQESQKNCEVLEITLDNKKDEDVGYISLKLSDNSSIDAMPYKKPDSIKVWLNENIYCPDVKCGDIFLSEQEIRAAHAAEADEFELD